MTIEYYRKHVFICMNQKSPGKKCCANAGGEPFLSHLKTQLKRLSLYGPGKIRVSQSGCLGRCDLGPCLVIYPEGIWYTYTTFADLDEIIQNTLAGDTVVEHLRLPTFSTDRS